MRCRCCVTAVLLLVAANSWGQKAAPLPTIRQNGAVKQLFVDNKPFIMLSSGELHNSSASSVEYMKPIWDNLSALHLNTVIGTVSWELTEPVEGRFDFSLADAQISEARRRNMRLALIWSQKGNSPNRLLWVDTKSHWREKCRGEEARLRRRVQERVRHQKEVPQQPTPGPLPSL